MHIVFCVSFNADTTMKSIPHIVNSEVEKSRIPYSL